MSSFSFSAKTFFRSSALLLIAFCFSFTANHILADEDAPVLSMQKISDDNIRVFVDGNFFAEYRSDYKGTPIIWPICGPNQTLVTRAWPMIEDIDIDAL